MVTKGHTYSNKPAAKSLQIQLYMHAYPLEKVSARTERTIALLKRKSNADVFLEICLNFPEEIVS